MRTGRLRILPEEIAVPATRNAQIAHYTIVRGRLDKMCRAVIGPDQSAHVVAWRGRYHAKWMRVELIRGQGWPTTSPGWNVSPPIKIQDPEHDDEPHLPRRVLIREIIAAVSHYYETTVDDMLSQRRTRRVIIPRHVAMYLAKELTLKSLPEIGGYFGGRDHTTVLHAVRKITRLIKLTPDLARDVVALRSKILGDAE